MAILIGIVHRYGAAVSTWDLTPLMLAWPARRGHNPATPSV
jgi:hypothetical protein